MRYRLLGRSGLRVSELCLGTMTFGEEWGWGASREECARMVHAFREAGGNFFDTANRYTDGRSERILGELLQPYRQQSILATKYSLTTDPKDPNAGGNQRKNMVQSLEASLRRLATDYLDLYWVHVWDPRTPSEEVMRGLDDLVRSGKVLYVGISDTPAWVIARANMLADLRGWSSFVALQVQYSLLERTVEREILPMARHLNLAVMPWAVLGDGMLTGKYMRSQVPAADQRLASSNFRRLLTDRNFAIADVVCEVAQRLHCAPAQIAIAWLLARRTGTNVIPLIGARNLGQLTTNLHSLEIELAPDVLQALDDISAIELGFPHDFLERGQVAIYGDAHAQVDGVR